MDEEGNGGAKAADRGAQGDQEACCEGRRATAWPWILGTLQELKRVNRVLNMGLTNYPN